MCGSMCVFVKMRGKKASVCFLLGSIPNDLKSIQIHECGAGTKVQTLTRLTASVAIPRMAAPLTPRTKRALDSRKSMTTAMPSSPRLRLFWKYMASFSSVSLGEKGMRKESVRSAASGTRLDRHVDRKISLTQQHCSQTEMMKHRRTFHERHT